MKCKSEFCEAEPHQIEEDLISVQETFSEFNEWIKSCTSVTPYPFSKEIYGVSSKSYKFQTSMAMILAALYKKVFILKEVPFATNSELLEKIKRSLLDSFLEDPEYNASSTNSFKIDMFIEAFK